MKIFEEFIFENYSFDSEKNEVQLNYSLDGAIKFKETIRWDVSITNYNKDILDKALFGLWIMAGVSYFKAYLPRKITINKGLLTKSQANFFNKTYELGLAQFFYTNQLDWQGAVNFEANSIEEKNVQVTGNAGALSAIGGGKDSIVAAELLSELNFEFDCWTVNQARRFNKISAKIEKEIMSVSRKLDPKLSKLNSLDAYNGHVPITAINSFIGVTLAILTGKKDIVWAIENSADEPNTRWDGLTVNHQYSKSFEFEKDMRKYIIENIASDLDYYSILRPFSELRIAEIFCKNYLQKYKGLFSSCNANFTLGNEREMRWCGKCPKCAFVFIIFSPFLKKSELLDLFDGKNIYADEEMAGTIKELLGISGHKPLECVGEIAETRYAIQLARKSGQYPELEQFDFPVVEYKYKKWGDNFIPQETESKFRDLLTTL